MSTGARLLELLGLLQNHRYWSGEQLARRLEVSPRTLRRDVEQLRELGYPVETARGVGGGYQLAPGGSLPPLVIDDEEAMAVVLGLQSVMREPIAGIDDAAVRALAKVIQVMPRRLRRRAESLRTMTVPATGAANRRDSIDIDVLATLAQSCRDAEIVRFGYLDRSQQESERLAEPHRLVPVERRWYLVAYDLDRHDWRSFRIDRIRGVNRGGRTYAPRRLPADDAAQFVRSGFEQMPARYQVEVIVRASVEEVQRVVAQWGTVTAAPGGARLRMSVDDLEWVAFILGALGAPFAIVGPEELRDYLDEWAARFAAAGNHRTATGGQS